MSRSWRISVIAVIPLLLLAAESPIMSQEKGSKADSSARVLFQQARSCIRGLSDFQFDISVSPQDQRAEASDAYVKAAYTVVVSRKKGLKITPHDKIYGVIRGCSSAGTYRYLPSMGSYSSDKLPMNTDVFLSRQTEDILYLPLLLLSNRMNQWVDDLEKNLSDRGVEIIGGVKCRHLGMTSKTLICDVWVSPEKPSLIRKISIKGSVDKTDREDGQGVTYTFDNWVVSADLSKFDFKFTPPEGTVRKSSIEEYLSGRPIPAGHEVYTGKHLQQDTYKYNTRTLVDAYRQFGVKSPAWDEAAISYISDHVGPFSQSIAVPDNDGIIARGRAIIDSGCSDPLVLYLYGRALINGNRPAEAEGILKKSVDGFLQSKYPKCRIGTSVFRLAEVCRDLKRDSGEVEKWTKMAIKLLAESVADGSFLSGEQRIFLVRLDDDMKSSLFGGRDKEIYEAIKSTPGVDP
ncbi:MAG: DUF2092 domain-containing protein, partial [bacterium]|nr:DUF2092 domain-containing protein [bacterium]